uniref:Uncharacterized protein n=1 Tax=Oryza meridionalis TaxID=40149 RepID=A0A0E0C0H1_9ORYZ
MSYVSQVPLHARALWPATEVLSQLARPATEVDLVRAGGKAERARAAVEAERAWEATSGGRAGGGASSGGRGGGGELERLTVEAEAERVDHAASDLARRRHRPPPLRVAVPSPNLHRTIPTSPTATQPWPEPRQLLLSGSSRGGRGATARPPGWRRARRCRRRGRG